MWRLVNDKLMPLAASLVVGIYTAGVLVRRSTHWYEWLAAAAGLAFAAWFWYAEIQRARRRSGKSK